MEVNKKILNYIKQSDNPYILKEQNEQESLERYQDVLGENDIKFILLSIKDIEIRKKLWKLYQNEINEQEDTVTPKDIKDAANDSTMSDVKDVLDEMKQTTKTTGENEPIQGRNDA